MHAADFKLQTPKTIVLHFRRGGTIRVDVEHLAQSKTILPILHACIGVAMRAHVDQVGADLNGLDKSESTRQTESPMDFLKRLEEEGE